MRTDRLTRALVLALLLTSPGRGQTDAESQDDRAEPSVGGPSEAPAEATERADAPLTLIEGTHHRLILDADVIRVAVGRSQTLSVEILESRELLLLGHEPGRTSLFVWLADGRTVSRVCSVEPDLAFLREALVDIHPSITVELAPHQGAVVLRGLVPDLAFRTAADSAAAAYLDSRSRKAAATPLVLPEAEGADGELGAEEVRAPEEAPGSAVINLIQLEELPALADEKIRRALEPMEGTSVSVRRVQVGDFPDDSVDLFVLEGTVRDQVTLTRTLFLASRALLGADAADQDEIRVLADEGGALTNVQDLFGSGMVGGGSQQSATLFRTSGGSGSRQGQTLANRIGANLGRAKVIEAAAGRILAMVSVEHLPLVRVDVRLYEVNLTRLRQWGNDLAVIASDFDQGALQPSPVAESFQGDNAASVGPDDIQNIFGFLGGEFGNQTQFVTGGLAVDNLFTILVQEQVARSLSRPTLTVLSGELALFQVGGQVPVPVAVTVGGGTDQVLNGVEFRDFGVQLSIRPLVEEVDAETITLDLSPIVSLPDLDLTAAIGAVTGSDTGTTAFETRGTRTHTRLRDGDAMLIGGLISQRVEAAQAKTPGLGDVPGAGWLFRNDAENAEDFELVIVVNPVIVRAERPDARLWSLAQPADALAQCLDQVRGREHRTTPEADDSSQNGQNTTESGSETLEENESSSELESADRH